MKFDTLNPLLIFLAFAIAVFGAVNGLLLPVVIGIGLALIIFIYGRKDVKSNVVESESKDSAKLEDVVKLEQYDPAPVPAPVSTPVIDTPPPAPPAPPVIEEAKTEPADKPRAPRKPAITKPVVPMITATQKQPPNKRGPKPKHKK